MTLTACLWCSVTTWIQPRSVCVALPASRPTYITSHIWTCTRFLPPLPQSIRVAQSKFLLKHSSALLNVLNFGNCKLEIRNTCYCNTFVSCTNIHDFQSSLCPSFRPHTVLLFRNLLSAFRGGLATRLMARTVLNYRQKVVLLFTVIFCWQLLSWCYSLIKFLVNSWQRIVSGS